MSSVVPKYDGEMAFDKYFSFKKIKKEKKEWSVFNLFKSNKATSII